MKQSTEYLFTDAWRSLDSLSFATAPVRRKEVLSMTAERIRTRFRKIVDNASEPDPCELIGCYNNAGLAFYQQCRADRAREISEAALALCEAGWRRSGWAVWCGSMLGPYVNVAKLASVGGDTRTALDGYRAYYTYLRCGGELQIGNTVLTQDMVPQFSDYNQELKALRVGAAAVYLADTAKAHLLLGDFEGLFEFVESVRADPALSQASRRQTYVIAEIRARALEGLGRCEEALAEYQALLLAIPQNLPGPLALWAHVARLSDRLGNQRKALEELEAAENAVTALPLGPESAMGHYYAHFGLAFARLDLGDPEGAYHGARNALNSADFANHTVGTTRASVLLRLTASITGTLDRDATRHDLASCKAEISANLYGFERAAAIIQLARAESLHEEGKEESRQLLEEAVALISWLQRCNFKAPFGFYVPFAAEIPACNRAFLADQHLDKLYGELMDYASSPTCAIS